MRMRPKMVDGKAVEGARVTVPVNFVKPTGPAASKFDTPPEWLRKPTFDQLMANYPAAAMSKGISGQAVIKCTVTTEGFLTVCSVVREDQPGMGFGPAALVLSRTFLMKPATKNGQPVEAQIDVPIYFKTDRSTASAALTSTTVLGSAIWARTPTVPEILAEIDKKVGDKFADGKVVLQCDLARSTGRMSNCVVANTSPGMAQFTGVARSLVSKFQADPKALADIKGGARINIAFGFPDMASPAWSQRYLTHPQWTQTISPDPNQPLFPEEAAKAGLRTGSATVDCVVAANGSLSQCKAVSESTPGVGFGPMAEQIASVFVLNPWTVDGLPADGAHVKMPVRMVYDDKVATAAPTPATKP
jgi:TonB family protein